MASVDEILMRNPELAGEAQEDYAARKMRENRSPNEPEFESFKKTEETFQQVIEKKSIIEAIKRGAELGLYLRREIADGKFDAFIVILILSLLKDIPDLFGWAIDFAAVGAYSAIVNTFISVSLFLVFFLQKSRFKRWLVKKFLGKYIIVVIAEFIPGFNIFPAYTVSAILLKLKSDKRIKDLNNQLEEVDKKTAELKNRIK